MGKRNAEGDGTGVAMPRTLFHIIKHPIPTASDFLSGAERGQKKPNEPTHERFWHGFSAFNTLDQAYKQVRRYPRLGDFIAEIAVANIAGVEYQQTFGPGHYTVWAEPGICARNVVNVYTVLAGEEE